MSASVACFYGFLSGAPLIATKVLGLPPSHIGFYMGSTTLGFFVGSYLSRHLSSYFAITQMILIGRIVAVIGMFIGLTLVLLGNISAAFVFGPSIFIGLGNGLSLPSNHVGIMNVRSDLAGTASGLSGAMYVGFGAILATLMGALLSVENGAHTFLLILLITKIIGLIAAIWVHMLERRKA
jgi:MFS family permease